MAAMAADEVSEREFMNESSLIKRKNVSEGGDYSQKALHPVL